MTRPRNQRIVFYSRHFSHDDRSGAAVATRAIAVALVRQGFEVELVSGNIVNGGAGIDVDGILSARKLTIADDSASLQAPLTATPSPWLRFDMNGVTCSILSGISRGWHPPDEGEVRDTCLFLENFIRPRETDALLTYGGDPLTDRVADRFREAGAAVVFHLHNFQYRSIDRLERYDAIVVPSRFSADFHSAALGLACTELPSPIDPVRVHHDHHDPRYLTYVNPSVEKGVFAFARIADELGRRRPDIPVLVVEGRGDEATVASCGLELRERGTVFFMGNTPDPRQFWQVSRICLIPSLWWESQCLVACESLSNGIPVIASDRGALPEILGGPESCSPCRTG